jgi:hypothetical protein
MTLVIIIFGVLTLFAGIVILVNPETIFSFLRNNLDKLELHILAVAVRLILGALLISQSGISKFPLAMEIIGWLSIIAAIVLGVIGRYNFKRLMSWSLSLVKPIGRIGGVLAVVFGVFLVYAFV